MTWEIRTGSALDVLRTMEPESVQCVVTSPPYWGLRDYGTGRWEGGDGGCDHVVYGGGPPESSTLVGTKQRGISDVTRGNCPRCGARRIDRQIGLEASPEEYVATLVEVFREVRRVLRKDGTVWLNLGDCYATFAGRAFSPGGGEQGERFRAMGAQVPDSKNPQSGIPVYQPNRMPIAGLKPKDLVGIPWRVAFALQADGWWLRSDIIWAKPNPMPESVTDRPTKAHEYLFLLTKSGRYYYDQEAVAETSIHNGRVVEYDGSQKNSVAVLDDRMRTRLAHTTTVAPTRNLRSVWTVTTEPFPEAHFATFPRKLVEPCIKAGSRPGDVVLDPFCGSGTTGVVALQLGRLFVGIDLSPTYAEMAERRIHNEAGLFSVATQNSRTLSRDSEGDA
jgi:DNA modification methylase